MMRLRVHHLFCSALFVGEGYSEEFCVNMQKVVQWLWEAACEEDGERKVTLVLEPDSICAVCPNQVGKGCILDDNHVVSKDAKLAQALGLTIDHAYSVSHLLQQVAQKLTKEIFETSCNQCEWYQMGLCSYEKLAEKYETYLQKNIDK
ncbi:MAG: DUF1284 domain-containing protein [Blautia sp.]|nr:DUF1284 domain-containing protein [Lachnoclostridium sp.]MCM1212441.1 DUF1284 domain-containing protein [Blautia sp.]